MAGEVALFPGSSHLWYPLSLKYFVGIVSDEFSPFPHAFPGMQPSAVNELSYSLGECSREQTDRHALGYRL